MNAMAMEDAKQDKPEFCCPITLSPMHDPVVFTDGHTYEKEAIVQHIAEQARKGCPLKSPVTNETLKGPLLLAPNKNLRDAMEREGYELDRLTPTPNLRCHTVPVETFCQLLGAPSRQEEWLSFAVDHIIAAKSVTGLNHIANTLYQLRYDDVGRLFQLLESFPHAPLVCVHVVQLLLLNLPLHTNKKKILQALYRMWQPSDAVPNIRTIECQAVVVKLLLHLSRENLKRGLWWEDGDKDHLALQLIRSALQPPISTLFTELTLQACELVADLHNQGFLPPASSYREIFWGDLLQLLDSPAAQSRACLVHPLLTALRVLMEPTGASKAPFNLEYYNVQSLPRVLAAIAHNINYGTYGDCSATVWSSVIFTLHTYLEISAELAPSCILKPLLQSCDKYCFIEKSDKALLDSVIATATL